MPFIKLSKGGKTSFGEPVHICFAMHVLPDLVAVASGDKGSRHAEAFLEAVHGKDRVLGKGESRPGDEFSIHECEQELLKVWRKLGPDRQHEIRDECIRKWPKPADPDAAAIDKHVQALKEASAVPRVMVWVRRRMDFEPRRNGSLKGLLAMKHAAENVGHRALFVGHALEFPEGERQTLLQDADDLTGIWEQPGFDNLRYQSQAYFFLALQRAGLLSASIGVKQGGMDLPAFLGVPTICVFHAEDTSTRMIDLAPVFDHFAVVRAIYLDLVPDFFLNQSVQDAVAKTATRGT